tara:strand:+ start:15 stop:962 length:948 start_codon:yes stop_codon:yes gene_type:complete
MVFRSDVEIKKSEEYFKRKSIQKGFIRGTWDQFLQARKLSDSDLKNSVFSREASDFIVDRDVEDFNQMKHFFIDETSKIFLSSQFPCKKIPSDCLRLPFDKVFVETLILDGKEMYWGFELTEDRKKNAICVRTMCIRNKKMDGVGLKMAFLCSNKGCFMNYDDLVSKVIDEMNEKELSLEKKNILRYQFSQNKKNNIYSKKVRDFIKNLIIFFNQPSELVTIIEKEGGSRKIRELYPINPPSELITFVHGDLKTYYNYIRNNRQSFLNYKFWVRGHWRYFKSERYKKMKGKMIFILPHLKGQGEEVNQSFEVKAK